MDERVIKSIIEARWADGQIVRNRLEEITFNPMQSQEKFVYEFKPKGAKNYDNLLTLNQLEIGRSYELIVSTLSGLYRYKTQKTLLVVGHHHDTPTVIIDKE